LYAAFYWAVLRRQPLLFETHQLETGFKKWMQRSIMSKAWVTTVVISERLADFLCSHHGVSPRRTLVLHDAARDGIATVSPERRRLVLEELYPLERSDWQAACGYFGHLYAGRGVEIIESMALARPDCLFLIYGGNEIDVDRRRAHNGLNNLRYMGHVAHPVALRVMSALDVLLMPYQASVSIGVAGHDTARWMSPMKMFEYMASGVPIISSDLPVLREVLHNGVNALLVPPDSVSSWVAALDSLIINPGLGCRLGATAHADYLAHHTWTQRALCLMQAASKLS
jgi:hypothetical protein